MGYVDGILNLTLLKKHPIVAFSSINAKTTRCAGHHQSCIILYDQLKSLLREASIRGGFKKFEEKCCQIVTFHGKFTISMHVVHKHIVNICTKFEYNRMKIRH